MKKRNLKKLSIQKQVISNFKTTVVIGGGPTNGKKCEPIPPPQSDPCVTLATCFCTIDAGCLLTFEVDTNGNLIC